jgi:choline dehydrogenase
MEFDYIVVGGGSAGCVVANRLSADPAMRVALVEAGSNDQSWPTRWKVNTPVGNPTLLNDSRFNWQFVFQQGARLIPCPRGKLLGGSSSVNGMIYMRGHPSDYDRWAELGNEGWGWQDVLPAYLAHEDRRTGTSELHAAGGELTVMAPRQVHPASEALVEAATQLQFRRNADFNGPEMDGFGVHEVTQRNGQRWSSARAFIHPIEHRKNFTLLTGALACRVVLEGRRATGLAIRQDGQERMLTARRDIVLAGGAINSPQLLLLSGIGPGEDLQAKGIAVRHHLPGVGRNLQDHVTVPLTMQDPTHTSYRVAWSLAPHLAKEGLRYILFRRGTLASNAVEVGGFVRTRDGLEAPDIQYFFMPALKEGSRAVPRTHGFITAPILLRPKSRGHLELVSADPAERPKMVPNFLSEPEDAETLVAGLQILRRIVNAPAFARYRGPEILPGEAVKTKEELIEFAHKTVSTIYHPVGTCRMGHDDNAVVDPQLRVHGIEGLRVADCSIMPTIVSGNTNAPAMMIGERCAGFMRADAA